MAVILVRADPRAAGPRADVQGRVHTGEHVAVWSLGGQISEEALQRVQPGGEVGVKFSRSPRNRSALQATIL
jgi:hypothetical protein